MIGESYTLNNRYIVQNKIGHGGFAEVFRATDPWLKRQVAVKVLSANLAEDESFMGRFQREAQSVASLDHPNILGVFDFGFLGTSAYLVMPLVEGGTLFDKLRQNSALSVAEAGFYLNSVASALDYAHRRNIIHRDIKPQNMLIRAEDNRLLLADFGIAKVIGTAGTHKTQAMGTISYMAPEQFDGTVSIQTDIYALGCVLFQMLSGKLPFTGETSQVMAGHMMKPVPSVIEANSNNIPPGVQAVIEKAMAKKPEDRYRSAGEIAQAYQAVLNSGNTVVASGPDLKGGETVVSTPQPHKEGMASGDPAQTTLRSLPVNKKSTVWLVPALAGFIVIIAAVLAFLLLSGPKPSPQISPQSIGVSTSSTSVPATATSADPVDLALKDANDTFYVKGDLEGGNKKYLALSSTYPNNSKIWRDYGNALHLWGRNGGGLAELEKANSLNPKDPVTWFYLTDAYLDNSRNTDAENTANTALKLDPGGWRSHAALAEVYVHTFRLKLARQEFDSMLQAGTNETDPIYYWIKSLVSNSFEDYTASRANIEKTVTAWPRLPLPMAIKGQILLYTPGSSEDDKKQGQDLLNQALQLQPDSSELLQKLAAFYAYTKNDLVQGEKFADDALAKNPRSPRALEVKGFLLAKKGDYTGAYQNYNTCLQINSFASSCAIGWISGLIEQGDAESAKQQSGDAAKFYNQALEKAKEATKNYVQTDSTYTINSTYYGWLGAAYDRLQDYPNAIDNYKKAINNNLSQPTYYGLTGLAYLNSKDRNNALDYYNQGIKKDPDKKDSTLKQLGEMLNKS